MATFSLHWRFQTGHHICRGALSQVPNWSPLQRRRMHDVEHFSYATRWTMWNQIYAMDKQLPEWKGASISTPNGWRFLYFRDPVECVWYLLRQCPYTDCMVHGPTWTVNVEGDRVYSKINSADWLWEMQDRLLLGATIVPLVWGMDET